MKRLMTFELQPRAISRHCFAVLVNNIRTATSYNTVRSLEKRDYIFTYERVLKEETGKKVQHISLQIQGLLHFYHEIGTILRKNENKKGTPILDGSAHEDQELQGKKNGKDTFILRKFTKILCHFSVQSKCSTVCQSNIQRPASQHPLPAWTVSSV